MFIDSPSLRKFLELSFAPPNVLQKKLRIDIREEISRLEGHYSNSGGGDFHSAFWSDAKGHVSGGFNLPEKTNIRIEKNKARERLYPLLQAGFLQWWNEKRRWSNLPFEIISTSPKGRYEIPAHNTIVKVENVLAFQMNDGSHRIVYPYFSEVPILSTEGARMGLWIMNEALEGYSLSDLRILDVLRSQSFSIVDCPLQGNEEHLLVSYYEYIMEKRDLLKEEY